MAYKLRQTGGEVQDILDAVNSNTQAISSLTSEVSGKASKSYVDVGMAGKVDKEINKGLSSNDYTDAEKQKLEGLTPGAEVNVIEVIKVNGVTQPVVDKAVNITTAVDPEVITNAEIDALFD